MGSTTSVWTVPDLWNTLQQRRSPQGLWTAPRTRARRPHGPLAVSYKNNEHTAEDSDRGNASHDAGRLARLIIDTSLGWVIGSPGIGVHDVRNRRFITAGMRRHPYPTCARPSTHSFTSCSSHPTAFVDMRRCFGKPPCRSSRHIVVRHSPVRSRTAVTRRNLMGIGWSRSTMLMVR